MTIEYYKYKNSNRNANLNFINKYLDQLTEEISAGKDMYNVYINFKLQEAEELEKNSSVFIKGKLDSHIEGEAASIAHILSQKKKRI